MLGYDVDVGRIHASPPYGHGTVPRRWGSLGAVVKAPTLAGSRLYPSEISPGARSSASRRKGPRGTLPPRQLTVPGLLLSGSAPNHPPPSAALFELCGDEYPKPDDRRLPI